jgi:uncharacterized RDD family membrane protein YckC
MKLTQFAVFTYAIITIIIIIIIMILSCFLSATFTPDKGRGVDVFCAAIKLKQRSTHTSEA